VHGEAGPPDAIGDTLAGPAVALVHSWLTAGDSALTSRERSERRRFQLLTGDVRSLAFTMAFCDRVLRPESNAVAAAQLTALARGPAPAFLGPGDRLLLAAGAKLAAIAPAVVMPLTRRRLRQIVGGLVVDRSDRVLARRLRHLRRAGFAVNVNLLGESVLGEQEAQRRVGAIAELIARPDVDYVSVKASAIASQLNLWGYQQTLQRVTAALRPLYEAASASVPTFLNLDMEEYRDLRLTVDAFKALLDEEAFRQLDAGIVLQAYLPDSFDVLREIVAWADERRDGAGTVKVRIVKGANLAMEAVDAATHGWHQAPYATKAETDANYKRMLDWALDPARLRGVRIGVASHNLFDITWAHLLAVARGVAGQVEMEMLQGMAPGLERVVQEAAGQVRLYTPVVAIADFDSALAYLFRRLEENSSGENFLRRMFDLGTDSAAFAAEQGRFATAVAGRWQVSSRPRRHDAPGHGDGHRFHNTPDSDPSDPLVRERVVSALDRYQPAELPDEVDNPLEIDRLLARAKEMSEHWASRSLVSRSLLLQRVAQELASRRPELLALMAHEGRKTVSEGDGEVSEAIDMAAYYAEQIPGTRGVLDPQAHFEPLGVVVVTPPWNFPLAITAGGVFAALAAGNAVILKPPPQTPGCAFAVAEAVWAACLAQRQPTDIVQYLRCPEEGIGEYLIAHPGVDGIVLTGARETAELFSGLAPETPLFAETSGKNALVVMPDADLDLAAADLISSAFGHAGQKCSAASLAICVGDVYTSARFRRQLVDAARSLTAGSASDPAVALPPLIGPPSEALQRALNQLDPGEKWLLKPELLDPKAHLWSPGIKLGVRPGSWFHRTECFGPVLGLMAAATLDEAIELANATSFGLTGGIHSLDPVAVDRWVSEVQVGNAYVNRVITGAVVQRQPFGGWKGSVVGPGAKAGGPNYVAQLGRWRDAGLPTRGANPAPEVAMWAQLVSPQLSAVERQWLEAAIRSDAAWQRDHFGVDADPTGLFFESNVFRYRPFPKLSVRVCVDARRAHVARVVAAARLAGCAIEVSAEPDAEGAELPTLTVIRESSMQFVDRLREQPPDRVRVVGTRPAALPRGELPCFLDDRPVVADAGVEGLRYRREQAVSRTLHRFGNVIDR
jgi:RHH-type proline utilization regulon transcriptional repressor/proline dehydrogenase/delta 1-pyrroline-5-carboxylate dehydrogenase